jgi:hypothetical protein
MFSIVKKVVAGPKRLTNYDGEELDLTYITDRVIAMAFPASDFIEKTYRNSIQDVANYLEESHHSHYLIINVSSRTYDYSVFNNRVKDYEWADHQTPPFATLVQAAYDMYHYLSGMPFPTQASPAAWWPSTATTARDAPAPPSSPSCSSLTSSKPPATASTSTTPKDSAKAPTEWTNPASFAT